MCLDTVTKINLDKSGVGWKVFVMRGDKVYGLYYGEKQARTINIWLKEKDFRDGGELQYPYGFHIYTSKGDAAKWVFALERGKVIRVKYRKGHTLGTQVDRGVIVAKEMLILPNQLK